jgi:hypothetical protein
MTKARKEAKKIFVFSNFRVFVINPPQADHKMQRIHNQDSNTRQKRE